jgi:hypothetical protein
MEAVWSAREQQWGEVGGERPRAKKHRAQGLSRQAALADWSYTGMTVGTGWQMGAHLDVPAESRGLGRGTNSQYTVQRAAQCGCVNT